MSTTLCPHCGQPVKPAAGRGIVRPNTSAKPVKRLAEIVNKGGLLLDGRPVRLPVVIEVVDFYRERA